MAPSTINQEHNNLAISLEYAEALYNSVNCLSKINLGGQAYQVLLALMARGCVLGAGWIPISVVGDLAESVPMELSEISRAMYVLDANGIIEKKRDNQHNQLYVRMRPKKDWMRAIQKKRKKAQPILKDEAEMDHIICMGITISNARLILHAVRQYLDKIDKRDNIKYIRKLMDSACGLKSKNN